MTLRVLNPLARPLLAIDVGTSVTRACSTESPILEAASSGALHGGVVCDIAAAAEMIAPIVGRLSNWRRPAALICAPTDVSAFERDILAEAVSAAGATVTRVVPEPLAAAIGAGVDISSEYAQLIVDIGDGVTDAAVISNGTICRSSAMRFGCAEIRRSVSEWLLWQREITVDDDAADRIVRAYCAGESRDDDLGAVIDPALDTISAFVAGFLRGLPDSLAVEVIESGVHLTGGGSLLRALVKKIESATRLRAFRAADPLHAVVAGARAMLSA